VAGTLADGVARSRFIEIQHDERVADRTLRPG